MNERLPEKVLHEPLSNYIAGTYNTLLSVVQGVSLGGVFYVITVLSVKNLIGWISIIKIVVVICLIALLWHRYVVHNQFAVWRLEIQDTIIPIIFGTFQFWLVLAILKDVAWFSGALASISMVGVVAYINTVWRYEKSETILLFKEHFKDEEEGFGETLRRSILKYQKVAIGSMAVSMILNGAMTIVNIYCYSLSHVTKELATCVVAISIIIAAFVFDLRWWLKRKAPEAVKQYTW